MTVFVVLGHVHYIYHKFVLVNISCNDFFYNEYFASFSIFSVLFNIKQ